MSVWRRINAFLALLDLAIRGLGEVLLLYNLAPWRRQLIRDNQLVIRISVCVILFGPALCSQSETKKQVKTKCETQTCTSVDAFHRQAPLAMWAIEPGVCQYTIDRRGGLRLLKVRFALVWVCPNYSHVNSSGHQGRGANGGSRGMRIASIAG